MEYNELPEEAQKAIDWKINIWLERVSRGGSLQWGEGTILAKENPSRFKEVMEKYLCCKYVIDREPIQDLIEEYRERKC